MISVLLGLAAGALTTLSPCVLPVLPFILLAALDKHRFGPVMLAAGMATTFAVVGVLGGASLGAGFSGQAVRFGAALLMALFGVILMSTSLQQRFASLTAPLLNRVGQTTLRFNPGGLGGQFASGALLGAIWSPCSGPTLGVAVTLAATSQTFAQAALIMFFFGIGAALPMLALAYGSRATLRSRGDTLRKIGRIAKPLMGGALLAVALLVLTGMDRVVEAALVWLMPDWLTRLTTKF